MLQRVVDRLDIRIGVGHVFGYPPALYGAVGKGLGRADDLAFFKAAADHVGKQVNPAFRRDVGLALFDHRRDGRHRVADDDLGVAAKTFIENELVEAGENLGALPVHAGNGQIAAFRCLCGTSHGENAQCQTCRCKKSFHFSSLPYRGYCVQLARGLCRKAACDRVWQAVAGIGPRPLCLHKTPPD